MPEPRRYTACCTDLGTTGYEKVRILLLAYDAADAIAQIGLVKRLTSESFTQRMIHVPHYNITELRPWVQELDGPWLHADTHAPINSLYIRHQADLPQPSWVQRG